MSSLDRVEPVACPLLLEVGVAQPTGFAFSVASGEGANLYAHGFGPDGGEFLPRPPLLVVGVAQATGSGESGAAREGTLPRPGFALFDRVKFLTEVDLAQMR